MVKENSETLFQKNFSEVVKRGRKHITLIILILTTYTVLSHMIRTSNDLDTNEKAEKTPDYFVILFYKLMKYVEQL